MGTASVELMDPFPDLIGLELQPHNTAQRHDLAEALAAGQSELQVCAGQHRMHELVQGVSVYLAFITVSRSHDGCPADHPLRLIRLILDQPQADSPKLGQFKPCKRCGSSWTLSPLVTATASRAEPA